MIQLCEANQAKDDRGIHNPLMAGVVPGLYSRGKTEILKDKAFQSPHWATNQNTMDPNVNRITLNEQ